MVDSEDRYSTEKASFVQSTILYDFDAKALSNSIRPSQSYSPTIKWRCRPELVQIHRFRSVEVMLDTPPGSPKNCPEAKGGSVRVQISTSRPVSVFMMKPRLCPSRDQSSPVKTFILVFGHVLSDQPAASRLEHCEFPLSLKIVSQREAGLYGGFKETPYSLDREDSDERGHVLWLSITRRCNEAGDRILPIERRNTKSPGPRFLTLSPNSGSGTGLGLVCISEEGDEGLLDRPDESSEAGSLERARKVQRGRVLRPRSQAQSPGLLARPVSVAIPSGGAREAPDTSASSAGDRALNDEIDSSSHRSRRWVLEEINSVTSGLSSPRLSPLLRASGEGTSWVNPGVLPSSVPEAFSWSFAYDSEIPILENPDSLAAIWCKAMEASNDYAALMEGRFANFPSKEEIGGHLLTIQQLRGELDAAREAERQRKVEIEKLKKKLAAAEAEKVVVQSDLDSMKEKYRREIEGRDRNARKDLHLARVSLAKEYEGVLAVVKGKLEQKKKETAAEILLHETRARIEALTEYSEGGFELEAELERLKDLEVSFDVDYGLASVSDPYLGRLDLPEIPGDSVNQD
ncbi:hypothetical protein F2Q68_00010203 [Brassica cretica]|uniref:Uncharacterized protein n=1 Tax=Brassica cretica TaxID=69181 RepID=A0A8S9KSE0_BRACR|nr:hypothetical protein F2Q68_00010203 [Brassica cretica]